MQPYQNSLQFFPNFGRGGGHQNQFFPKFKKVQNLLGGGGVKKIMDFFHNLGHFFFDGSPKVCIALSIVYVDSYSVPLSP